MVPDIATFLHDFGQSLSVHSTFILMLAMTALAAAAGKRRYADMALALITAEAAALPVLLAPLRLDSAALAPLEASLAMLPARALAGDDAGSGATA